MHTLPAGDTRNIYHNLFNLFDACYYRAATKIDIQRGCPFFCPLNIMHGSMASSFLQQKAFRRGKGSYIFFFCLAFLYFAAKSVQMKVCMYRDSIVARHGVVWEVFLMDIFVEAIWDGVYRVTVFTSGMGSWNILSAYAIFGILGIRKKVYKSDNNLKFIKIERIEIFE